MIIDTEIRLCWSWWLKQSINGGSWCGACCPCPTKSYCRTLLRGRQPIRYRNPGFLYCVDSIASLWARPLLSPHSTTKTQTFLTYKSILPLDSLINKWMIFTVSFLNIWWYSRPTVKHWRKHVRRCQFDFILSASTNAGNHSKVPYLYRSASASAQGATTSSAS